MAGAAGAQAAVVVISFSGIVTSGSMPGIGETYTGAISFDDATPVLNQNNDPGHYQQFGYVMPISFQLSSGSFSLAMTAGDDQIHYVTNATDPDYNDHYQFRFRTADWEHLAIIDFIGPSTAMNSTALPSAIDFASFPASTLQYTGPGNRSVNGPMNAIAAVPEPATWGTMILGFGMAGAAMRRGRRVRVRFG